MSENQTQDPTVEPTGDTPVNIEALTASITEKVKAELTANYQEQLKKETSGRDSRISELTKEMQELKKNSMTDSEKFKFELQQKEEELKQRQSEIDQKESEYNRMRLRDYAGSVLAEKGLINGLDAESVSGIKDMVFGSSNEEIAKNVERLILLQQQNQKQLYANTGQPPKGGNNGQPGNNPWNKDSLNLTEQMKIAKADPERAKMLKAAAKG